MERFELRGQHLELLQAANVSWNGCEFGAPTIDPKRPYGNGNVCEDIARILNIEWQRDEDDDYMTIELRERLTQLHRDTETALQIVLATGTFEPGVYMADDCRRNWRPERKAP